jgi:hypothetical protein
VQLIAKHFADRLNKTLDELDMPTNSKDRASTLAKMLDIPKQQAWTLIDGQAMPNNTLLERIATELEVDSNWLMGE